LYLHNGSLEFAEDPESELRPIGRKRDRRTNTAKIEADKRLLEEAVAAKVSEEALAATTPRKKVC
jgi:hypothetical protein